MFRLSFNNNMLNKTLRNLKLLSQYKLPKNSIQLLKEPIDANVVQQKDLIKSTRSPRKYKYSKKEIQILNEAVMKHGKSWDLISKKYFPSTRSPMSLSLKWSDLNPIDKDDKLPLSYYLMDKKHFTKEWTKEEDKILLEKVIVYGTGNWARISMFLPNKNKSQVCHRYSTLISSKKGEWSKKDDQSLLDLVKEFGKSWHTFSEILNRPFYIIAYRYEILTNPPKPWTKEEKIRLNNAVIKHGENWTEISKLFPDRKSGSIKVHYQTNAKLNPFVNIGKWKTFEVSHFKTAFKEFGKDWKKVAKFIGTRSPIQCYSYWRTINKAKRNIL